MMVVVFKGLLTIQSICCEATEHGLGLLKKICKRNGNRKKRGLRGIAGRFDIITLSALKYNTVDIGKIREKHLKKHSTPYYSLQNDIFINEMIDLCPMQCQPIFRKLLKIKFNRKETIDPSLLNIWRLEDGYYQVCEMVSRHCNNVILIDLREEPNVANLIEFRQRMDHTFKQHRTRKQLFSRLVDYEISLSQYGHSDIDRELLETNFN